MIRKYRNLVKGEGSCIIFSVSNGGREVELVLA